MPHFEGLGGNLVVVARAPIEQVAAFAREKGWKHARLVSAARNSFRRDYGGDGPDGEPVPIMTVFKRGPDGVIRLHWASELVHSPTDPGQGHAAFGHGRAALDPVRSDARRAAGRGRADRLRLLPSSRRRARPRDLASLRAGGASGRPRRNVQRRCGANERLQRLVVNRVALVEIDGAPGIAFEAGVEKA